jgi:hypothetical protein
MIGFEKIAEALCDDIEEREHKNQLLKADKEEPPPVSSLEVLW